MMNRVYGGLVLLVWLIALSGCISDSQHLIVARSMQPVDAEREALVVGEWMMQEGNYRYSFADDYTLTSWRTIGRRDRRAPGAWRIQEGRLALGPDEDVRLWRFLSNTILVTRNQFGDTWYLRKVDETGQPTPVAADDTVLPLPLFDGAQVTSIRYESSYAPAPDEEDIQFVLRPAAPNQTGTEGAEAAFIGIAEYYVPDQDWVTDTVDIALPTSLVMDALAQMAHVPVWQGAYRANVTHTDDYPDLRLVVIVDDAEILFATASQGDAHVPWLVVVGGQRYVTFSYAVAEALDTLRSALKVQIPWVEE